MTDEERTGSSTPSDEIRRAKRREYKRKWQAQWRTANPEASKEQIQKDWYNRSLRMCGLPPRKYRKVFYSPNTKVSYHV